MAEAKRLHRFSDPSRLVPVDGRRPPRFDGAVVASPGADVTQDQEGCGTGIPAFPAIGAAGFFANGVELEPVHRLFDLEIVRAGLCVDFKPSGQARPFGRTEIGRAHV